MATTVIKKNNICVSGDNHDEENPNYYAKEHPCLTEELTVWRQPLKTFSYACKEVYFLSISFISTMRKTHLKHIFTFFGSCLLLFLFAEIFLAKSTVKSIRADLLWGSYWAWLGILSQIWEKKTLNSGNRIILKYYYFEI